MNCTLYLITTDTHEFASPFHARISCDEYLLNQLETECEFDENELTATIESDDLPFFNYMETFPEGNQLVTDFAYYRIIRVVSETSGSWTLELEALTAENSPLLFLKSE